MPNLLAYLMLAVWPLVALQLFRVMSPARALVWTLLAGYLLLPPPPAGFDPPLLPGLNKDTIPPIAVFALTVLTAREKLTLWPESLPARWLVGLFVLSPLLTTFANTDPVFFGFVGLPGMKLTEGIALAMLQFLLIVPFLLARALLADEEGHRILFTALMLGGLAYSLPMLLEVRLSPQLNLWVYGYFQHYFAQMIRAGGFRPIVFLYHGLWAAFFAFIALSATLALARTARGGRRQLLLFAGAWLAGVLVLCKSLGSALYGLAMIPLLLFTGAWVQIRLALLLALLGLSYPVAKSFDWVPSDYMVEKAAAYDEQRGASLKFRFDNENVLFERARLRPLLGWGSWGRNQIYHPISGEILTVTDGRWIITLGIFGWLGFLAEFGLLTLPIWLIWRQARRKGARVPPLTGAMTLILAVNIVDLIPNATLTILTWLMAGALLGTAERMRATYVAPKPDDVKPPTQGKLETVL